MAFINKADFDDSIYNEIRDVLTRGDDSTLDSLALQAIDEVAGYLSARYDTAKIFAATGNSRNKTILMWCKDITLYHLHSRGNPSQIPDIRVKRYDDAIKSLKAVQKQELNLPDLPLLEDDTSNYIKYGFNDKRNNHY